MIWYPRSQRKSTREKYVQSIVAEVKQHMDNAKIEADVREE